MPTFSIFKPLLIFNLCIAALIFLTLHPQQPVGRQEPVKKVKPITVFKITGLV